MMRWSGGAGRGATFRSMIARGLRVGRIVWERKIYIREKMICNVRFMESSFCGRLNRSR